MIRATNHRANCGVRETHFIGFFFKHLERIRMHIALHLQMVAARCQVLSQRQHVDTVVAGADAFFPQFDAAQWRTTWREAHDADARHAHAFEFVDYERA